MAADPREIEARPGRSCPIEYRYPPRVFDREPEIVSETVYVVGGLYGNVEALDALERLVEAERGPVAIVFNGDFHWFDVARADFDAIEAGVRTHCALRGNVETQIAGEDDRAGCGCAYPADVSDAVVARSNEILGRLRETARAVPGARERLAALPMHRVARVGDARVGIVHGDAASLAGWSFARDRLDDAAHRRWIESAFADAKVDLFASTHTCDAAMRRYEGGVVANNGAAGMPNFEGRLEGLVTRISTSPFEGDERLYGTITDGAHVDAVALRYDAPRWLERFLASWPEGSPAHASYHARMTRGARATIADARPG